MFRSGACVGWTPTQPHMFLQISVANKANGLNVGNTVHQLGRHRMDFGLSKWTWEILSIPWSSSEAPSEALSFHTFEGVVSEVYNAVTYIRTPDWIRTVAGEWFSDISS